MKQPIPATGRTTFTIHAIVAVIVGVPLLVAPLWFGECSATQPTQDCSRRFAPTAP